MTAIKTLVIETPEPAAAEAFYARAFGLDGRLAVRHSDAPSAGYRGFDISLVVAQPGNVDAFMDAALAAGAAELKPAKKSMWGYGGVLQAPDGTIWKLATSSKKDTGPATRDVDSIVLGIGVDDVPAAKRFYAERGLAVAKSFGRKYVEFEAEPQDVGLVLYGRRFAAKQAGVDPDGSGSHRLVIGSTAEAFTDLDGFVWEQAAP